ncbi:MAG: TonB-dependent receptor [Aliiglaciecola sp.]|uniref:TonB-dependent receptor n=1 Tax=Aliiglaciecola sp. TaxID=1872441 RepID=UPI003299B018
MKNNINNKRFNPNKLSSVIKCTLGIAAIAALQLPLATGAVAQEQNNDESSGAKEPEVITVSGVRSSLDAARDIKRFANTVVDAISAEDIGQFTDDSIAQAIQRIPGVQIETDDAGTDGDRVSIRGLGPEFVNSTINGRVLLSSGNEARSLRKMNFNVFPPSVLSGVEVSKGQTATRPESGLAGQVNLQTLRPLDVKSLESGDVTGKVSLRYEYEDLVGGTGTRLNGLVMGKNDEGNLGGYVGLVTSKSEQNRDQVRLNRVSRNIRVDNDGDGVQDEIFNGIDVPSSLSMNPIRSEPERTAIAAGVQYRNDSNLEIVWDMMYSQYDNKSHRNQAQLIFTPSWAATVFDGNNVEINDQNLLTAIDYNNYTAGGAVNGRVASMKFDNNTENLITGLNFDWQLERTNVNLDFYYSEVDYAQDLRFSRMQKSLDKSTINMTLDGEVPIVNIEGFNDPEGYVYLHSIVREIELTGENFGVTLSLSTDIDSDFISSVDYGASYSTTDIDSARSTAPSQNAPELSAAVVANALTDEITPDDFLSDVGFEPSRWLQFDLADVGAIHPYVTETTFDDIGFDPEASHRSKEDIISFWGQANFDSEIGDISYRGNVGLRAVLTDHSATAGVVVDGAPAVDQTTGGDYWEYLPSVNVNFALTDELALRVGFSKTLSRPDYEDVAPIINVNEPEEGEEDVIGSARSGNVNLNPMTAYNYDITLEHYNEYDGAAVLSFFYKDVSNFIIDDTLNEVSIDGFDGFFNLTTPVNFSDGEASGVEVGIYQPFDKLIPALEGFGVSANYTYVDSSFDVDVGDSGFGFPGSSQDNFNFIGFYETELYTIRLAYTYRGDFFRSLAGTGAQTDTARFTTASESLDMNISYRPTKTFMLQFNASNLTKDNRRDFVGYEENFLDYFERGRQYALTATYKF